jgi:hypothetical protein
MVGELIAKEEIPQFKFIPAETPTQGQGSRSSSASAQGSRRTKPGLTKKL